MAELSEGNQAIGYYQRIIELYTNQPSGEESVIEEGRTEEAEKILAEGLELTRTKFGETSSSHAWVLRGYARFLIEQGEFPRAHTLYERCVALFEKVESAEKAYCLYGLATLQQKEGDISAAEQTFRQTISLLERVYGPDSYELIDPLVALRSLEEKGDKQEAELLKQRIKRLED